MDFRPGFSCSGKESLTFDSGYAMIASGDSMYNQEIKERFLSEGLSSGSNASTSKPAIFEKLGEHETVMGKDIFQMSINELELASSLVEIFEYNSAAQVSSLIKMYCSWCYETGVSQDKPAGTDFTIKNIDPTTQFARVYFRDELDFRNSLRKVRTFNEGYPEVVILTMAWLGLDVQAVLSLREQDVDLINRKIFAQDGSVLISWFSDEILDIFTEFSRCKSGMRENGNTTYMVVKDLSHDVFLKRFCASDSPKMGTPISLKQARSAVDKVNKQYKNMGFPPRFTQINIMRSGGLSRVFQLEQNGVNVMHRDNMDIVMQAYGIGKDYRKIMWQYKFYKKAFNL